MIHKGDKPDDEHLKGIISEDGFAKPKETIYGLRDAPRKLDTAVRAGPQHPMSGLSYVGSLEVFACLLAKC